MPSILKYKPKDSLLPMLTVNSKRSSKCLTQNYYIISSLLTTSQDRLFKYILSKARNSNYIYISTDLLKEYALVNRKLRAIYKNTTKLKSRIGFHTAKEDLISLIDYHAVIQLKPNSSHFIVNPLISYAKTTLRTQGEMKKFERSYNEIYDGKSDKTLNQIAIRFFLDLFDQKKHMIDAKMLHRILKKEIACYMWCKNQKIN
jgi:hypothetical protein